MRKPMVSVVMITYAHEKFIREAIQGVLMQEVNFEIELIIADDYSPDQTELIVNSFRNDSNYYRINYTKHKENMGMMPNFIWALKQTKGKYIALCEGDDYWTDSLKLQKQVDFLEANDNFNLITSNAIIHGSDNKRVYPYLNGNFEFNLKMQLSSNRCITCSTVFRSNQFNLDELYQFSNLKIGDIVLWALLLRNKKLGFYLNEDLSIYRIHNNGAFNKNSLKVNTLNELEVYKSLYNSELFNFAEKTILKDRIQIIWYDILHARNWFSPKSALRNVISNTNFNKLSSISILLKSVIRICFNFRLINK